MGLEGIVLREVSQKDEDQNNIVALIFGIWGGGEVKFIETE